MDSEELNEFIIEGRELLDGAEQCLLSLESGEQFDVQYDKIFRAFHNLKGSAGMLDLIALQDHMHVLETTLMAQKDKGSLSKELVDYFLKGCDGARMLLEGKPLAEDVAPPSHAASNGLKKVELKIVKTPEDVQAPTTQVQATGDSIERGDFVDLLLEHYLSLDQQFALLSQDLKRQELRNDIQSLLLKTYVRQEEALTQKKAS